MFDFLKKPYHPLNIVEVSRDALLSNYSYLSSLNTNISIAPVLKSNGYGHGLVNVAKILDGIDAPFLCVDSIYEGYELLKNNIKTPILIMGYIKSENLKIKKLPFSYAVYNREQVLGINRYQPHAGIHIFVDTGMHREGVSLDDLPEFLHYVNELGLRVEGLMSHFAAADKSESELTKKQVIAFEKAQEIVKNAGFFPKWIHVGASEALLHSYDLFGHSRGRFHPSQAGGLLTSGPGARSESNNMLGNVARVGIALYGMDPCGRDNNLKPALELVSTLSQIKTVKKGEKVGYDFTFTASKDMTIGILPIGYYDGVDRRLSNTGSVMIGDTICPIIGRVSMNLTTVDISAVKDPQIGDRVVVYSADPKDENSIFNAALQSDTIPYDLLVGLAASTKRIIK